MLRIASLIFALLVSWSACAQVPLTGAGKGAPGGVAYQGPGDVVAGAAAFWSCARSYTASYASGGGALCDVVDTSTGVVACTFHALTTGFVNTTECNATACAVACSVKKIYNQVSNGTADMVQATLASMPDLVFNSLNGLPSPSSNTAKFLATSSTITQATPLGLSAVFNRTSTAGGYLSATGSLVELRGAGSANNLGFSCGTAVAVAATDGAWHSANATCSNVAASDAINIDGIDTTGLTAGTTGLTASNLQIFKSNAAIILSGKVIETILYPFGLSPGQRTLLNSNQHSATSGYNF